MIKNIGLILMLIVSFSFLKADTFNMKKLDSCKSKNKYETWESRYDKNKCLKMQRSYKYYLELKDIVKDINKNQNGYSKVRLFKVDAKSYRKFKSPNPRLYTLSLHFDIKGHMLERDILKNIKKNYDLQRISIMSKIVYGTTDYLCNAIKLIKNQPRYDIALDVIFWNGNKNITKKIVAIPSCEKPATRRFAPYGIYK